MLLGDRGSRLRCLLVWASGTTVPATLIHVVLPQALLPRVGRGSLTRLPLDRAVSGLAATVLVGCAVWAWLALTAVVLEAARGGCPAPHRGWHLPLGVRRAVLAACGVALVTTASPALADGGGHHGVAVLRGLPLPDRATEPAPRATPAPPRSGQQRFVVVAPGDSLWSIAAAGLPPGAPDARITARWHAIYAANRDVVGADPDVLERGQRLLLPPSPPRPLPGKDPS